MMYEEFCRGVGEVVDYDCYARIEAVYLENDLFPTKQKFYQYYKKHGLAGVNALYLELANKKRQLNISVAAQLFQSIQCNYAALKAGVDELQLAFKDMALRLSPFSVGQKVSYIHGEPPTSAPIEVEIIDIIAPASTIEAVLVDAKKGFSLDHESSIFLSSMPLYTLVVSCNGEQIELSSQVIVEFEAAYGKKSIQGKDLMTHGYGKQYNIARQLMVKCITASERIKITHLNINNDLPQLQCIACSFKKEHVFLTDYASNVKFKVLSVDFCYQYDEPFATIEALGGRLFSVSGQYLYEDNTISNSSETIVLDKHLFEKIEEVNAFQPILLSDIV